MNDAPETPHISRVRRRPGEENAGPDASPPAHERPPVRTELREELRAEDPREAAARRATEILEHIGNLDEGTDEFFIDPATIPDGWTYEWKRRTALGQEDPAYQVALRRTGWTEVPATRHPEMMPAGWTGNTIERKGQVLMERPKVITDMVNEANLRRARAQLQVKEQQLGNAPSKDQLPRARDAGVDPRAAAGIAPRISREFAPMPIPTK